MHLRRFIIVSAFLAAAAVAFCQTANSIFDVASVRPSARTLGPDYNNQIDWTPTGLTAKNATLRRLVADAWNLQLNQIIGPSWLDRDEYDIEAHSPEGVAKEQKLLMLQNLLAERFNLKQHSETRVMRVYELTTGKNGPKIKLATDGESNAGAGLHFHGTMRQFADLLAMQFSIPAPENADTPVTSGGPAIPVLDKTGLDGIYDFSVDVRPELGTDTFTAWQRVLDERLGLRIESRKGNIEVHVVDDAAKVPSAN